MNPTGRANQWTGAAFILAMGLVFCLRRIEDALDDAQTRELQLRARHLDEIDALETELAQERCHAGSLEGEADKS